MQAFTAPLYLHTDTMEAMKPWEQNYKQIWKNGEAKKVKCLTEANGCKVAVSSCTTAAYGQPVARLSVCNFLSIILGDCCISWVLETQQKPNTLKHFNPLSPHPSLNTPPPLICLKSFSQWDKMFKNKKPFKFKFNTVKLYIWVVLVLCTISDAT